MIGSRACFVLVNGGHLQAILRPPGGRSAGYRLARGTPPDPDEWLASSKLHDASWWDHWLAWVERRSSGRRPAPARPGRRVPRHRARARPVRRPPARMSDRLLDVGGLRLAVRERGTGHPLLLVNGLGGNVDMWGPAQERLSEGRAHDRLRRAWHGPLADRALPMPIPAVARLIVRLLDELGLERVDVLGYSWGGLPPSSSRSPRPSASGAWRSPARAAAGAACPATCARWRCSRRRCATTRRRSTRRTSHLLDGTGGSGAQDGHSRAHAEARRANPPSLRGYWSQVLAGSAYSSLPWLHRIEAPTLVVSGLCDRLVPPGQRRPARARTAAQPAGARAREGHLLLFDPASAALPALAEFFADGEDSATWRDGEEVRDDARGRRRAAALPGGQPYKAFSAGSGAWFSPAAEIGASAMPRSRSSVSMRSRSTILRIFCDALSGNSATKRT